MKRIIETTLSILLGILIVVIIGYGLVMSPKFINKDNSIICITLSDRKQYVLTKNYEVYTSQTYKPNYLFGTKDSSDVTYLGRIDMDDLNNLITEIKNNIDKEGNNEIIINQNGRIIASSNKNPYEIIAKYIKKD